MDPDFLTISIHSMYSTNRGIHKVEHRIVMFDWAYTHSFTYAHLLVPGPIHPELELPTTAKAF